MSPDLTAQLSPPSHGSSRLTVVIPIRSKAPNDLVQERVHHPLLDDHRPANVDFLVVDDGSPSQASTALRDRCQSLGFYYVQLDTEILPFSIGRARNYGALCARSPYVMFQDVDLMPYPGFYRDVLVELDVQNLDARANDFLMIGVIYLTQNATSEFLETPPYQRRPQFIQYLVTNDTSRISKFSTGTSVTVYNRHYFLTRGGNDEDFEGWGFEDLEFNTRCIWHLGKFPMPEHWLDDIKNFRTIDVYRGWKSVYRLFGDLTFSKGICLFHAWHPVDTNTAYVVRRSTNQQLFTTKMQEFALHGYEPDPLPDPASGRTLLFRSNPFVYSREFAPKLGDLLFEDENQFMSTESLFEHIQHHGVDRILFHNPYANSQMRTLYFACREAAFPYYVAERGALPGSMYFDPHGFNADSTSYSPHYWDRPLSPSERDAVLTYITNHRTSSESLEHQDPRCGPTRLRQDLGLRRTDRVLFVPLQRPNDTVTEYQAGPIGSFDNFLELVTNVANGLTSKWKVVAKAHPLEDERPAISNVLYSNAHIDDLLAAADAVLTLNSGCGVLAMLWSKPVLYAGSAFYGHSSISQQTATTGAALSALHGDWQPDKQKTLRFLHYLIYEFYSFGTFHTRETRLSDGKRVRATHKIDFHVVRGLPGGDLPFYRNTNYEIGEDSILFDRYRHPDGIPSKERREGSVEPRSPSAPTGLRGVPLVRKLRKLQREPSRFFADSRHSVLRRLGHAWLQQ